jgi:adenylylsulfate kinase
VTESTARSFAKAVTYRFFGSLATAAVVFFFTDNVKVSVGAGLLDSVVKITLYFLHERVWQYIPFGRPKQPDYEI